MCDSVIVLNIWRTVSDPFKETSTSFPDSSWAITILRSSGDEPYLLIKSHNRATPILDVADVQNKGINV